MRFIFGMIIGALLTIGGAYVAELQSGSAARRPASVNWTVVGEKVDELTANLRQLWSDFTRQYTGPP